MDVDLPKTTTSFTLLDGMSVLARSPSNLLFSSYSSFMLLYHIFHEAPILPCPSLAIRKCYTRRPELLSSPDEAL